MNLIKPSIPNGGEDYPSTGEGLKRVIFVQRELRESTNQQRWNSVLNSTLSSTMFTSSSISTTKKSNNLVFFNEQFSSSYDDKESRVSNIRRGTIQSG